MVTNCQSSSSSMSFMSSPEKNQISTISSINSEAAKRFVGGGNYCFMSCQQLRVYHCKAASWSFFLFFNCNASYLAPENEAESISRHTIKNSNFRLQGGSFEHWPHHHWQILLKLLPQNFAHSSPS